MEREVWVVKICAHTFCQ